MFAGVGVFVPWEKSIIKGNMKQQLGVEDNELGNDKEMAEALELEICAPLVANSRVKDH